MDLDIVDFFWPYHEETVYTNKLRTLDQIRDNIPVEIEGISRETLGKALKDVATLVGIRERTNGNLFVLLEL